MSDFYCNCTRLPKQPPKCGYGFLEAVVKGVTSRAGELIKLLEVPHRHGGNPGYPAEAMLGTYIMQFAIREPYANACLDQLGGNERLLKICGSSCGPSEQAYCHFKKKLANHVDLIQNIIADVFLECGVEIKRLRAMGLVPADNPPLGEALVMDSTDVEAWVRPARKIRKTGEEKPSKDPDAKWGHRTAKNVRSSKPRSGKRRKGGSSKKGKANGAGIGNESGFKASKSSEPPALPVNAPGTACTAKAPEGVVDAPAPVHAKGPVSGGNSGCPATSTQRQNLA